MNEAAPRIPPRELTRSPLSLIDETGAVFLQRDRVLRGVSPDAEARVRALLASSLLQELQSRRWVPRCELARVAIEGYPLVVEQERLPVVTYPFEWTYGMVRDAAVRVLEIAELAERHGWELKDCHGFNLVFDGPTPLWVDLGSFVPRPRGARGWSAHEEFLRCYDYPLRIWSDGSEFTARRLLAFSEPMSHADWGLYRWPWLRRGGAGVYQRWWSWWYRRYRELSRVSAERIRGKLPGLTGAALVAVNQRGWIPWQSLAYARLRRRVAGRARHGITGIWSGYQSAGSEFVESPRFRRIRELMRALQVESVLELGGNQGWLSERLLAEGVVRSAICTDADEGAVDQAYERARRTGGRLHTAVLDFMLPLATPFGEPPVGRFRADAVCALAVTHHLLLTQRFPVDRVLRNIAGYARRHVLVEFMPLGLWDGRKAPPVPPWYSREWFREAFVREFELCHEEQLEENRILFCGTLRGVEAPA